MLNITRIFFVLSAIATSQFTFAHSEHDKARFVAKNGKNAGKCDQVLRPCKSIAYAVQQANKGDKILVASGTYTISSEDDLFYFKSGLVPIKGGYNRFDHFQSQSPQSNITTIVGVPAEMRTEIEKMGFAVAIDGKHTLQSKALSNKIASYHEMSKSHAAEQCVNNTAGAFECANVDLLAHMPLSSFSSTPGEANDIWGHVDLNTGYEYAIIGLQNGVSVVNVSDPENPVEVGTIDGASSTWRDIKVYQHFDESLNLWRAYAYATIDRSNQFVSVISLNNLPETITLAENNFSVNNAHNVYISNVDHSLNIALADLTPSLQLVGSNKSGGAFRSYSLENPETISLTSTNSAGDGYTHDGASIVIKDDRKTTECAESERNCTVFIDFQGRTSSNGEDVIKLWNISDPSNSKLLSTARYNDISVANQYIHSGWATEDNNFFLAHDEFDEGNGGLNTTIRIFSIEELKNPQQVGTWTGTTNSIDHNGFVRGNRYYMSNYMKGLTVLDISDPSAPLEVGSFDTYTTGNHASYDGAWGVYPFLPSGNILVSDITGGLFILKDNTLDSVQGTISFNQAEMSTNQGQTLQIDVHRNAPSENASSVAVSYELIPGSALQEQDYTPVSGTLTWTDNEDGAQSFTIPVAAKGDTTEFKENFFVRLFNPRNGATLSSPSYLKVNIDGAVNNGKVGFTLSEISVPENQGTLNINVARDGSSSGEVVVNYSLRSVSAETGVDIEAAAGTLTWQDGNSENKMIMLTLINDNDAEVDETVELVLESTDSNILGTNSKIIITINDDDSNNAPEVSIGENIEVNTGQSVTLNATAADAENDEITFAWSQSSGNAITFSSSDQQSTTFVAPATAGSLEVMVTATDVKGASSTASIIISVIAPTEVITITSESSNSSGSGSLGYGFLALLALLRLRSSRLRK
jgi:choice-of-anchor B domain-containing protein